MNTLDVAELDLDGMWDAFSVEERAAHPVVGATLGLMMGGSKGDREQMLYVLSLLVIEGLRQQGFHVVRESLN